MLIPLLLAVTAAEIAPPQLAHAFDGPRVSVWTNREEVVRRGDRVRVFIETDQDAFVTVMRVDTDGRVRVLFPLDPHADNYVRGGRRYEVDGWGHRHAFVADDDPGMGYLFAAASLDPFDYAPIMYANRWDYRTIAQGHVRGDPYVALTDLTWQLLPYESPAWDYDITPYYVGRRYDYPRFLCYECHSYVGYAHWDPYRYSCVRFRIVVYDDPYYYPYRYYQGTRVVFVRPARPSPRYVFKTWDDSRTFVTRVRERPVEARDRREPPVNPRRRREVRPDPRPRLERRRDDPPGRVAPRSDDRRDRPRATLPGQVAPRSDDRRDRPRTTLPGRAEPRSDERRERPGATPPAGPEVRDRRAHPRIEAERRARPAPPVVEQQREPSDRRVAPSRARAGHRAGGATARGERREPPRAEPHRGATGARGARAAPPRSTPKLERRKPEKDDKRRKKQNN